jgi:hypothetical protein
MPLFPWNKIQKDTGEVYEKVKQSLFIHQIHEIPSIYENFEEGLVSGEIHGRISQYLLIGSAFAAKLQFHQ